MIGPGADGYAHREGEHLADSLAHSCLLRAAFQSMANQARTWAS